MESLSEEDWDLVIAGTSLPQSLLALSLSRSHLKILHVDQNQYYGGIDAGLSIEDAEKWAEEQKSSATKPAAHVGRTSHGDNLASSRSYTLNLNPQIIYASSAFLPAIVTSRLHSQLDFLAVGSWWMLQNGVLQRIPTTREDVFANEELPQRDKFRLMKFLRHVVQSEASEENATSVPEGISLSEALSTTFRIPPSLQSAFTALALSNDSASATQFDHTVSRLRRHMKSMNHFGPGFAAVYPKYAGNAEVAQVSCRAGAVGGATYLLGQGIESVTEPSDALDLTSVQLSNGTVVKTKLVVGSMQDLPSDTMAALDQNEADNAGVTTQLNSITVISSSLAHLFPQTSDNGPIPAIAIVSVDDALTSTHGPIYLQLHSEDTGECPTGQCCVYGSVIIHDGDHESATKRLQSALTSLISKHESLVSSQDTNAGQEPVRVLWSMTYPMQGPSRDSQSIIPFLKSTAGKVIAFPPRKLDVAFDDSVLDSVREVWRTVVGDEANDDEFLIFAERQNDVDDNDQ